MMDVQIDRHVVEFQAGNGTNAPEYTTCPGALPRTTSSSAAGHWWRNQRSPGSVGSASSSSGLSRASSSGRRLRIIRCGLGPAYFLDGTTARLIPVVNQKGEQV